MVVLPFLDCVYPHHLPGRRGTCKHPLHRLGGHGLPILPRRKRVDSVDYGLDEGLGGGHLREYAYSLVHAGSELGLLSVKSEEICYLSLKRPITLLTTISFPVNACE